MMTNLQSQNPPINSNKFRLGLRIEPVVSMSSNSGENDGLKFCHCPFNKPNLCRKLITRFIAIATMFVIVCEFLYVSYATSKGHNYMVHQQSTNEAFWENFWVILESILVMPFAIFMALVFFLSIRLHCWSFTIVTFILLLSIGYNFMWILEEGIHLNLTSTEKLKNQVLIDLKENFEKQGYGILPAWLYKLQLEGHCCGIDGPSDWKILWKIDGLPKSCCFPTNSNDMNVISCEMKNLSHYVDGCLYAPKKLNKNDMFWLLGLKMYKIIFIILLLVCMCLAPDMVLNLLRNVVDDQEAQIEPSLEPPTVEINDDEFVDRLIQIQRTEDHNEALKMSLKLPLHSAKARFSFSQNNNNDENNNSNPILPSQFSSQFSIPTK